MITKLTKQQRARLKEYKKEGIKIGISTDPTGQEFDSNFERIKSLIQEHRKSCNQSEIKEFKVFDSPYQARKKIKSLPLYASFYGQHDINWLIYYMFYRNECGLVKQTEKIVPFFELAKLVNWVWLNEDTCVIVRKPVEIYREERIVNNKKQMILHKNQGLALKYRDGFGVYKLNFITIPEEFKDIMETHPDDVTISQLQNVTNVEMRNEFLKRSPHLMDSAKILDEAKLGDSFYLLKETDFGNGNRRFLTSDCPSSGKKFTEFVPPEIKTCAEALAWREYDIELSDLKEGKFKTYIIPQKRT